MWDLPGPGLEPVSPALAGGFLTNAPPGKPLYLFFTLKSAPDAIFKKSHPTFPSSSPTLESNIMLLGDTGVMPTPQGTSQVLKTYLSTVEKGEPLQ